MAIKGKEKTVSVKIVAIIAAVAIVAMSIAAEISGVHVKDIPGVGQALTIVLTLIGS